MALRRELSFFDVTNITVGAIVGADIYVASAITAGLLGPASLLAWLIAGILAIVLALCLAECANLVPSVGGPYAYVTRAFGRFPGFLAGWSMWIAELTALPVFAIAFTNYLGYFVDLSKAETQAIRLLFLASLTYINVLSVRAAGRFNDALTLLKLSPLLVLVVAGFGHMVLHLREAHDHLTPFAPYGFANLETSLLLVFWAYAGFELSTVPSGEVRDPQRTIPRAIAAGMAIVAAFYLSTNFVVYGLVDHTELAGTSTPLTLAGRALFGGAGAALMAFGAMISVSGSDESDMLGSSRLAYAMAADGMLPGPMAAVHRRFGTPYVALIAQGLIAGSLSFVDKIPDLISFAVVNLGFSFLLCAVALILLQRGQPRARSFGARVLPYAAAAISLFLLVETSADNKLAGGGVLAAGLLVYLVTTPGRRLPHELHLLWDHEWFLAQRRMRFLGGVVGWLGGRRSTTSRSPAFKRSDQPRPPVG